MKVAHKANRKCGIRAWLWGVAALLVLILVYGSGVVVRGRCGMLVVVQNRTGTPLRHVQLRVETRGRSYDVPEIPPGKSTRIFVQPVTESHIDLHFADVNGAAHSSTVVGYAEAGY